MSVFKSVLLIILVSMVGTGSSRASTSADNGELQTFSGNASWYGAQFHGKKTASGELFDMFKVTGAHRTLHLPTKVLAENPRNGKSTVVRVNDRGPFVHTRVMDLSRQGAIELGYLSRGTAYLEFTILSDEDK